MYYIDAAELNRSNWLRFVNCPNTVTQLNLLSFVCKMTVIYVIRVYYFDNLCCVDNGNVFYLAARNITVGEELLVYYGENYARKLGIDTTQFP